MKKHILHFLSSGAVRVMLALGGFLAFLWPYFASSLFKSLYTEFVVYFVLLGFGVAVAYAAALADNNDGEDS